MFTSTLSTTNEMPTMTIGFHFVDEYGNEYNAESSEAMFDSSPLEIIGRKLDAFLKQISFVRDGEYILMDSLTEDEYDKLSAYLQEMRYSGGIDN